MAQVAFVTELRTALAQYIDPDGNTYSEEIAAYADHLLPALQAAGVDQVLFWDDQDGGDPTLDLEDWDRQDVIGLTWNSAGDSYYGLTGYVPKHMAQTPAPLVWHLWFGGSPLNSAPGFYVVSLNVNLRG